MASVAPPPVSRKPLQLDRVGGPSLTTPGRTGPGANFAVETQPQQSPGGLLGQVTQTIGTPLDFSGSPEIRPTDPINPSASPVDVPWPVAAPNAPGALDSSLAPVGLPDPVAQPGQFQQSAPIDPYRGQRVGVGPAIDVGQSIDVGQAISAPALGEFFTTPTEFQNALPTMDQYGQDIDAVEQATYQRGLNRVDPYLTEQREQLAQQLQNQGIPINSEAFNREMDRFGRERGDVLENLALSSVGAGRQEHGRLQNLARALRAQEFGEGITSASFNASEAARRYGQALSNAQFNQSEAQRMFGNRQGEAQRMFGNRQGEAQRGFGNRLASEGQFAGQQRFADQFGLGQNQFRDQFGAGQAQQDYLNRFNAGQQGFQNQLANQQLLGQRDAFNAAQQNQAFQNALQAAGFTSGQNQQQFANQFANQGLLQQNDAFRAQQQRDIFGQDLERRRQNIWEQQTQRQQPLTDLAQILGLVGQPQQPQFQPTAQFGPMPVDYTGNVWNNYNAQMQRGNAWLGLLGGLGGAGLGLIG